jgi:prephenate dehydratase
MKIAIQGGKASFHDIAARKYFGKDIQIVECQTFKELCKQLDTKNVDYAVMAIENSIAGSILGNYSLMQEHNFVIIGEIELRIEQNLMVNPGVSMNDLKKVMSHYMALMQCDEFLVKHPEILEREEYYDTADSAKFIKEHNLKDTGAIASRYAAELYGLEVVAEGIETVKQNYTRFVVLSKDRRQRIEGSQKATLSFQLPNKVGALANMLRIIVDNKINLTKIQSLPILGRPNEYTFYVDCEWERYEDFRKGIEVKSFVNELRILGEYKKGETIHDYSNSKQT